MNNGKSLARVIGKTAEMIRTQGQKRRDCVQASQLAESCPAKTFDRLPGIVDAS